MELAKIFIEAEEGQHAFRTPPMLFYLWGHSYEFDRNDGGNSWERIEEFCKLMGGRSDIWYATNIEIIDYLQAVTGLLYTASADSVYNPSAQSVWLIIDGNRIVEVKGGQQTKLS